MSEDRVVELRHPGSFSEDPLTSVLRSGAQRLLAQAVEMEVAAFIAAHGDLEDDAGRRRVVRHGHHRERRVQTGIGPVAVRCPRDARPRGCGRGRQDPFHLGDPAALPQAGQVDRGALALALPEGHLDGRLHRGPGRSSGAGRARALGLDDHALEGCLARRAGALGKSATSRPGAISISGPTGSISSPGWSTTNNASWSSSAPTSGAARNCWQSPTAIARAPSRGASCCSISSGAASRWRPSWPSETGRSASGRPCARATARRANSAAGCTRPATF